MNMTNKRIASFNIKSIYTNLPVEKYLNLLKTHRVESKNKFFLQTGKIIKICRFIATQWSFMLKTDIKKLKYLLQVWLLLSSVIASIFFRIPLISYFQKYCTQTVIDQLNNVEPIKFTYEMEEHSFIFPSYQATLR